MPAQALQGRLALHVDLFHLYERSSGSFSGIDCGAKKPLVL
jgi:hypothetical protein